MAFLVVFAYSLSLLVVHSDSMYVDFVFFFFQAEDGIRDLVRSRGLGDVYKRQGELRSMVEPAMYFGIGFLVAVLLTLGVIPLVHALSLIHI